MRFRSVAAAAASGVVLLFGAAVPAAAAPPAPVPDQPKGCPVESWVDITSRTSQHIPIWSTHIQDGPGGRMTATVQRASTITASISTTVGVSTDEIVVAAKSDVSGSITGAVQITTGHSYSQDIRPGYYGHMVYGSYGYSVRWTKYVQGGNCKTTSRSGSALLPTNAQGWKYWETR